MKHAKVIWLIRISLLRNWRHCTHLLCWNIHRSFDWSKHSSKKSETLHSHSMLEYAKVILLIRTSLLRNQRHFTYHLYWNIQRSFDWSEHLFWESRDIALTLYWSMQKSFDWSEHPSWEIRGTTLTAYVGACQGHLIDQNISSHKSQIMHSQTILEYSKVIWLVINNYIKNTYWLEIQCI